MVSLYSLHDVVVGVEVLGERVADRLLGSRQRKGIDGVATSGQQLRRGTPTLGFAAVITVQLFVFAGSRVDFVGVDVLETVFAGVTGVVAGVVETGIRRPLPFAGVVGKGR